MKDAARRLLIIMGAILVAYFFLHVLRSFAVEPEARGLVAGTAGYLMGDLIATSIGGRRKRS